MSMMEVLEESKNFSDTINWLESEARGELIEMECDIDSDPEAKKRVAMLTARIISESKDYLAWSISNATFDLKGIKLIKDNIVFWEEFQEKHLIA